MDKDTTEVIRQLPYYNPSVTQEDVIRCMINNAQVYVYGNKVKILTAQGGMLIIDLRDVQGDLTPFGD